MSEGIEGAAHDIAAALERLAALGEKFYVRLFPDRPPAREPVITRIPTEEDKLRQAQGASEETLDQWRTLESRYDDEPLGPRERALKEREEEAHLSPGDRAGKKPEPVP